jgi:2'-5' RNA ligase
MPFAIELLFDSRTDKAVRKLGRLLENKKIPTILSAPGASPHLTLAVFDKLKQKRMIPLLDKLARRFNPIPFALASLGNFPGKERALFLAPVVTPDLLKLHQSLHLSMKGLIQGELAYYFPGRWVPHCTLGMGLTLGELNQGFDYLQKLPYAQKGRYTRLALAEYHPVKEIYSVPLALPKG